MFREENVFGADRRMVEETDEDDGGNDEHERGVELENHSRRTHVVDGGEDALEDESPSDGVGEGVIVEAAVSARVAVALFEKVGDADDDAVKDVGNVGGKQVEGEISQGGGGNVTAVVEEANVSIAGFLHLLPVGDDDLMGKMR